MKQKQHLPNHSSFSVFIPALLMAICCSSLLYSADFVLFRNGEAKAEIVYQEKLRDLLFLFNDEAEKCTGSRLPFTREIHPENCKILFEMKNLPLADDDLFSIEFPDVRTMRISGSPRSLRWAVQHLLETAFGVRWVFYARWSIDSPLYPWEVNDYPERRDVAVPLKAFHSRPYSFRILRQIGWRPEIRGIHYGSKVPFAVDHLMTIDVFPYKKYAPDRSWPEAILPVINGKKAVLPPYRKDGPRLQYALYWNPCFTHPETTKIAIANIRERLAENPAQKVINLVINDNGGMCECENCRKITGGKLNSIGYRDYSVPYYSWVNSIAGAITADHPDVRFFLLAYRETMDPPPFRLHPNVIPMLCQEITALRNPKVQKKIFQVFRDWNRAAENVYLWDYGYGIGYYMLPRIYFQDHSKILKTLYRDYHLRGLKVEAVVSDYMPFEGPKYHLMHALLKDIDTDPEEFVMNWCRDAVGSKAAPFLREYYRFWENYWTSPEIRRTGWYQSVGNIYMQLGDMTHMFALRRGDMARLRSLMRQVVSNAESPLQKRRSGILMHMFEYSELAARATFVEHLTPEGGIRTMEDALELLRSVPDGHKALTEFEKHPALKYLGKYISRNRCTRLKASFIANIGAVIPYLNTPEIRNELQKLVSLQTLPRQLRAQFRIWLKNDAVNLLVNGSFEQQTPMPQKMNGCIRVSDHASEGQFSISGRYSDMECVIPAKPGRTYLLMFDAYASGNSGEGRLHYRLTPRKDSKNLDHIRYPNIVLNGRKWQTFSGLVTIPQQGNNLVFHWQTRKYEFDEKIWVDNIRLYCLDEPAPDAPPIPPRANQKKGPEK